MVNEESIIDMIRKHDDKAFTTEVIVEEVSRKTSGDVHYNGVRNVLERLYENNYLSSDTFTKHMSGKSNITVNRYYTKEKLYNTSITEILRDIG
jgi:predicted transcriptional regulator